MNTIRTYASLVVLAAAVLVLSACGGSSDSSSEDSAPGGSTVAQTVSVSEVDSVGEILVDADGAALYAADQEADGMIICVDACAEIWDPLVLGDGENPMAGDGISGTLDVVERPDGKRQVALDGRPLYRFVEDPEPGTVTGNGFADTFAGQEFVWHVATPTGVSSSSENSTPPDDGYGF